MEITDESSGKTYSLTEGDLIKLDGAVGDDDATAKMVVVTSKKGSAPAQTKFMISLKELQEFENEFHTRLEGGMEKMKKEMVDKK